MQPREYPAACASCALPRTPYLEYARAAGRACRAARRSSSTCAHHLHATRTTTHDFCLLRRPTRLPLDEVIGAVLHAAAPLGKEATSPRASEALSSRPGCSIDGRAAAAAGGCGGAPVSCGYATEAALGRLLEAAELTAAQVQSILH